MPLNQIFKISGHLVNFRTLFKISGISGPCSGLGSVKEPNILIYFFFLPIAQSCSVSDVLFTDGRGVSDFSVLKYYYLNSVNILNKYLRILIDCSQLSKTYYNVLFGSFTRDRHA